MFDDRVAFHYYATGITPAMTTPKVGTGSVYAIGSVDKIARPLDGSRTYTVTLPAPIPAAIFWSFMVYDNHTQSILETDQLTEGLDSNSEVLELNPDGSATAYLPPKAPEGRQGNWIQKIQVKAIICRCTFTAPSRHGSRKLGCPLTLNP